MEPNLLNTAPTDLSTPGLCEFCLNIDLDMTDSYGSHHANFTELEACGNRGCKLCQLISAEHNNPDSFFMLALDCETPENRVFYFIDTNYKRINFVQLINKVEEDFEFSRLFILAKSDDPVSALVPLRTIPQDCSSNDCRDLVLRWVKDCSLNHSRCTAPTPHRLPKRVIDVGNMLTEPRLVETGEQHGTWLALSHCWGKKQPLTTTTVTLPQRLQEIKLSDLPATFQDTVIIARWLGCRYIWIDSLCIIQDDREDWLEEAPKMGDIYQNALLTIAAEEAENSSKGLFRSTNSARAATQSVCSAEVSSSKHNIHGKMHFRSYFNPVSKGSAGKEYLRTRAWTLQEDILSPRVLTFAQREIFWRCADAVWSETNLDTVSIHEYSFSQFSQRNLMAVAEDRSDKWDSWYTIVCLYARRNITYQQDRLVAISAVARQFASSPSDVEGYKAGIWLPDAVKGLLWENWHPGCNRPSTYIAPSWSWASIDITTADSLSVERSYGLNDIYTWAKDIEAADGFQVIEASIIAASADPFGGVTAGFLVVEGQCLDMCLCRVPLMFLDCHEVIEYADGIDMQEGNKKGYEEMSSGDILHCHSGEDVQHGQATLLKVGADAHRVYALIMEEAPNRLDTFKRCGVTRMKIDLVNANLEQWNSRKVTII